MKIKKTCQQCKKEFIPHNKYLYRNPKYCSRKCSYLNNQNNLILNGEETRFKRGGLPWNKSLNSKNNQLIKIIAEKRRGQKRPKISKLMKELAQKNWSNDNYLFKIFKSYLFGKNNFLINEINKKIIKLYILRFKIRRSLNV